MKVEAIKFSNVNKIQSTKPNTQYHTISFGGEDEFVRKRQYKKYHKQSSCISNPIKFMNIDTCIITKPNCIKRMIDEDYDLQQIDNSVIHNIFAYKDCVLAINDSKLDNIENVYQVQLWKNSCIASVKNSKYCDFFGRLNEESALSNATFVSTSFCSIFDKSEVNDILSHALFMQNGAKVNNVRTNKLIISRYNPKFDTKFNTGIPVYVENADVVKDNINLKIYNVDKYAEKIWERYSNYFTGSNGFADIDFCRINNLKCELLNAKNAELNNVKSTKCDDIIDCKIGTLETDSVKNIQNSRIGKIMSNSDKFILNTDELSEINNIEFARSNGILLIKNNKNFIPDTNVINGIKEYEFKNIMLNDFTAQKNLTAQKDVQISTLTVTEPDAVVTIVGNSKIDNIDFKNGGKVVLKDDNGIHPDASKINVINGQIIKDYPLKGFEKIAGMEELKQQLREDVIEPLEHPEIYKKYGLNVINGFLMYGPPGCGKTFIAKQLAEETGRYFVQIGPAQVGSTYQYKTILNIKQKFEEAVKNAPSIVFIDEAESIVPRREALSESAPDYNGAVTELLQQLNNCKDNNVLVVVASNEPQKIDNAIKRTGRMDKRIFVGNPDKETRIELFKQQLNNIYKEKDIDYDLLAQNTEYYTAEDIRMIVRKAAFVAMRKNEPISQSGILKAIKEVKPSLSKKLVEQYYMKGEL